MKKYIFTFGINHPLGNHIQIIYADNYRLAREKMFEKYGDVWAFQYTEEEWVKWQKESVRWGLPKDEFLNPLYVRGDSNEK